MTEPEDRGLPDTCVSCGTAFAAGAEFCTACGMGRAATLGGADTGEVSTATLQRRLDQLLGERYRIEAVLGKGGMGAVFKGHDTRLDRPVAVKVIPPELVSDTLVTRFEREARTAAKLDHPGIIPIYHVDHGGDLYYLIMKFVSGRSLDELLTAEPLPVDFCQRVLWECASALGHAHRRGIIHRDIKPANVMIDEEGRVMITDFGISKAAQDATQITATGAVIGTPNYMSPEQAKGTDLDHRSDQYSLGLTGYHMLTGEQPFAGTTFAALIYKQIYEELTPIRELRPDVPESVAAAIQRAIAKSPDDRFDTMEEFATAILPERPLRASVDLGRVVTASGSAPMPPPTPTTPTIPMVYGQRRRRTAWTAGAVAVIVVGIGGWYAMTASQRVTNGGGETAVAAVPSAPALDSTDLATGAAGGSGDVSESRGGGVAVTVTDPAPVRPTPREAAPPTAPPATPVAQMGSLIINSDPFGTVYVDGVRVGDTPVVNHALTPGVHVIEVRREGSVTAVDTIEVVPGNVYRLTKILIPRGN